VQIEFATSITAISADDWNRVICTDYPFIQYTYLIALENTHCVSAQSGWQPYHLCVFEEGVLLAVMPLYLKSHSYGEYVFDFEWAHLYQQLGSDYYPKALSAIPFTPASGSRLYCDETQLSSRVQRDILQTAQAHLEKIGISGWHILFHSEAEKKIFQQSRFFPRQGLQYHWFNDDYADFDAFLTLCHKKARKNILRERNQLSEHGLELQRVDGEQLRVGWAEKFYPFYRHTYLKRSGHSGYLNQQFFEELFRTQWRQLMLCVAFRQGDLLGAALYFFNDTHLYGRYWGAYEWIPNLHFELCYYQGVEFAIEKKLTVFDAGAQGEHKVPRGFTPVSTYSSHWLSQDNIHQALAQFCQEESLAIQERQVELMRRLPLKRNV